MLEVAVSRRLGAFTLEAAFAAPVGVTALFGRSGAGKTALVDAIAGLGRPDAGRITLDGRVLFDAALGIDLPPERRRVGYVFQDARLFPHLGVRANLTYGWRLLPPAERQVSFDAVVALLGLEALLERRVGALSGGERQRVAIGRAVLASPRLLLMDEPLASLDGPRKAEILPFVTALHRALAIPIVYVSHAMEEILALADTLVLLEGGKVAAAGLLEEVMSRPGLGAQGGPFAAGAVVVAVVEGHEDGNLVRFAFAGGILRLANGNSLPLGSHVRLRIQAKDVALALAPHAGISILNQLKGRIVEMAPPVGGQMEVRLDIGCLLLARVTERSAIDLGLVPGREVYALIKSVAIERG